jgi:hypothetical protein
MLLQIKILIAIVVTGLCWWLYAEIGDRAVDAYKADQEVIQRELDGKQRAEYNKLSIEYEELKNKRQDDARVITKQVEKVVTRDVYRNICLDDDGLRIINEAISGTSPTKPDAEMPSDPAR